MKIADLLVEMLYDAGVRHIYAITGDSLNPINDAVRRDGRLKWVHVRHEEAGAYAASMEAELNGIGCCMGSSGPGHVHLINGLYDANQSGNPVIAIASTIATNKLGISGFQETNVSKLFDDCSKYCFMANTSRQAAHAFQTGIQTAIQKKGVAVIGLPGDVAEADLKENLLTTKNFYTKATIVPNEAEIETLATLINAHQKVMLYCGYGCKSAQEELLSMCEKLQAPMGFSYRAKIFFDKESNPYAVGMNGLLGNKSGFEAMHEADLLLMLGTDFPYSEFLPEKNTLVQIDLKAEQIGRRAKVDYGFQGEIKATIQALLPKIETKTDSGFLQKNRKKYQKNQEIYQSYIRGKEEEGKIHPELVADVIDSLANDDAIFTVDTGMSAVWAARYLKGKKNRYLTGSFNHGSMANAMPMALGAAFACEGRRQVIALCGDGGISMLLGDLMTISQYQLPVNIVIFDNQALGMVKLEMMVAGYPDWQTDMVNPDFTKLAEAMGIQAWDINDSRQLREKMKEAFAHQGSTLICVHTDPEALAMPPEVNFKQIKGLASTMGKMMLNGRFAEVIETAKSDLKYLKEIL